MPENTKTVVLINAHLLLGGVDTYLVRMSKWLRQHGYNVILLLYKDCVIEESLYNEVIGYGAEIQQGINCYKHSRVCDPKGIELTLPAQCEEVIVISTMFSDYFCANEIVRSYPRYKITSIAYELHPYAFVREHNITRYPKIFYKPFRWFYQKLAKAMIDNNNLIFMDEIGVETFKNYYSIRIENVQERIIRLGLNIREFSPSIITKRYEQPGFHILTIARFELPFKGYIIGLIRQFAELFEKYGDLNLTIIGWGDDEDLITSEIQRHKKEIASKINCPGKVDYDQLDQYFNRANVYVGMGTTLLDAANTGLIGITAKAYDLTGLSDGFFMENPLYGAWTGTENIGRYIEGVINLDQQQYMEYSKRTHKEYEQYYNIEHIMPRLLGMENLNHRPTIPKLYVSLARKGRETIDLINKILRRS